MREAESPNTAKTAASQLLVERFFQDESTDSFEGVWMCAYEVDDVFEAIDKDWMAELLATHDAVMYLPKLSNGIALDIRK